jgi:hypothetical protein
MYTKPIKKADRNDQSNGSLVAATSLMIEAMLMLPKIL